MRRNLVMVESRFPAELTPFFKNLENQSNPWGVAAADRDAWCADLDVPRAADGGEFEYLYYVGCASSFDDRAKKISRSVVQVLKAADVSFAILGREESCNGDQARRAGNEYLYQILAQQLIETLDGYKVKKIITTCPHCFNVLFNEYPDLGGHYEVIHHSSFIEALMRDGKLKLDASRWSGGKITYHDACYLGRHNGVFDAPRDALQRATGLPVLEMPRNREQAFCCGAGGSRMWMEEKLGTRINQNRVAEAEETGADVVATACPFCQTMVKDGISELGLEEKLKTFDFAEIVAETLAGRWPRPRPRPPPRPRGDPGVGGGIAAAPVAGCRRARREPKPAAPWPSRRRRRTLLALTRCGACDCSFSPPPPPALAPGRDRQPR